MEFNDVPPVRRQSSCFPCACFPCGSIIRRWIRRRHYWRSSSAQELQEPLLLQDERDAVHSLLRHIESPATVLRDRDALRSLTTLSYSDNLDLQRSAALTFAEVASLESGLAALTEDALEPLMSLAHSPDVSIQCSVASALRMLSAKADCRGMLVALDIFTALAQLLRSSNAEVQCDACTSLTNLSLNEEGLTAAGREGVIPLLLRLANSYDRHVQRCAAGALLNLTRSAFCRRLIVSAGGIPVLVGLLKSSDLDLKYFCIAALANIAVDERNREELVHYNQSVIIGQILVLIGSRDGRIQCQACLALRNLASSDERIQRRIVEEGGLDVLAPLLEDDDFKLVEASCAAARNLSILPDNEQEMVETGYIGLLSVVLARALAITYTGILLSIMLPQKLHQIYDRYTGIYSDEEIADAAEVALHLSAIIRNIASTAQYSQQLHDAHITVLLANIILCCDVYNDVICEATAALAVLCQNSREAAAKVVELAVQNECKLMHAFMSASMPIRGNATSVDELHTQSAAIICMLLTYATEDFVKRFATRGDVHLAETIMRWLQCEDDIMLTTALWSVWQLCSSGLITSNELDALVNAAELAVSRTDPNNSNNEQYELLCRLKSAAHIDENIAASSIAD